MIRFMSYDFRVFLKKSIVVTVLSAAYGLWFWRDAGLSAGLLCANVLSLVGLVFFVWALLGVVHNVHAMAAFSYSFRYVMNMVRNARNRDAATDENIIEYHEYVASYEKRKNVPWCFLAAAAFTALSLILWLIF